MLNFFKHAAARLITPCSSPMKAIPDEILDVMRLYVGSQKRRGVAMPLIGNWLLVQRLVTTALYNLLRIVFIAVQRVCWQLNGTAQKLRESRLPENYDRSAHVLDVVLSHTFCSGLYLTVNNFLCVHNRFENPQYVVDNEHVTLMIVTEHDAIFCEAQEKG